MDRKRAAKYVVGIFVASLIFAGVVLYFYPITTVVADVSLPSSDTVTQPQLPATPTDTTQIQSDNPLENHHSPNILTEEILNRTRWQMVTGPFPCAFDFYGDGTMVNGNDTYQWRLDGHTIHFVNVKTGVEDFTWTDVWWGDGPENRFIDFRDDRVVGRQVMRLIQRYDDNQGDAGD